MEYSEQYLSVAANFDWIVGIDEVGMGALAGPVYVGGVMASPYFTYPGLNDSKILPEAWRDREYAGLTECLGTGMFKVASQSAEKIDKVGIRVAQLNAVQIIIEYFAQLHAHHEGKVLVVLDGNVKPSSFDFPNATLQVLPKADTFVPAVMAAANIAKFARDAYMCSLVEDDPKFERYGFAENKGYGTEQHKLALAQYGITNEHRVCYRPVREVMYSQRKPT